jgi:crossover junction endodeoxyribonuclease RuvC
MIILGIDPGYGTVGFGVIESPGGGKMRPLEYGVIQTPKDDSLPKRLECIADGLKFIIEKYRPDAVAIEELFFQNNQKTAIAVAEARGAILLCVYENCKNLFEYTPMQIKQALTGYGKADKQQIQYMVKALLNLQSVPKPDDAADALAAAITHAQVSRTSVLFGI